MYRPTCGQFKSEFSDFTLKMNDAISNPIDSMDSNIDDKTPLVIIKRSVVVYSNIYNSLVTGLIIYVIFV